MNINIFKIWLILEMQFYNKFKRHIKNLSWRYSENLLPTIKFNFNKIKKRKSNYSNFYEIRRIIDCVSKNGYAVSSFDQLNIKDHDKQIEPLRIFKLENESKFYEKVIANNEKNNKISYQIDILDYANEDILNSVMKIIKHPIFEKISQEYFKMVTEFWEYSSMLTFPSFDDPKMSQLWHKDPEDLMILKYFIFLDNIELDNGPLMYAPGTHHFGKIKRKPKSFKEHKASRVIDNEMIKVLPKEKWISAIGKKGTIFFADTRGYHKGGYLKKGTRWIMQGQYISPSAFLKQKIVNYK